MWVLFWGRFFYFFWLKTLLLQTALQLWFSTRSKSNFSGGHCYCCCGWYYSIINALQRLLKFIWIDYHPGSRGIVEEFEKITILVPGGRLVAKPEISRSKEWLQKQSKTPQELLYCGKGPYGRVSVQIVCIVQVVCIVKNKIVMSVYWKVIWVGE